jgi:4-amino-4-deoxy-L-arabinose transferase-like glycosyltransferase
VSDTSAPFLCRRPFLLALLVLGVALRLYQYACDTSLWFDELSVARNIAHRSAAQLLLEPLAYNQVAPVGFIVAEKLVSRVLGESDLALRLFPLLCGLLALPLFLRLAERLLDGYAVPFAVAVFAIGAPFLRFSAEVKQYGPDLAATLALSLMALSLREADSGRARCVLAGIAGAVLVWFSQATFFVMAGLGAALVLAWLRDRDAPTRRAIRTTIPIWAAASFAAIAVSVRHITPETRAFMDQFWRVRGSFFPWPVKQASDLLWLWDRVVQIFEDDMMLRYRWPVLYGYLVIAGMVLLWRRNRFGALVLLGPIGVTVLAAVAHQYPFRTRLILFLVPAFVLAVAQAAEGIRRLAARAHPFVGAILMAGLFAAPALALVETPPPYRVEDYKTVLAFLRAHWKAGDVVYVFPNPYGAMERYGAEYGVRREDYVVGGCWRDDLSPYLVDVDRLRGRSRVWFFASSVPPFHPARRTIERYLQTIGIGHEAIAVPSAKPLNPVSVQLFDLSDPARLSSASALTFRVESLGELRPLCGDWVKPILPNPPL